MQPDQNNPVNNSPSGENISPQRPSPEPLSAWQNSPPNGALYQNSQPTNSINTDINNNQPSNVPLDPSYFNQIAVKPQKTVNKFAMFGFIGVVLVLVIISLVLFSSMGTPNVKQQLPNISVRISTLLAVTKAQQSHLAEDEISEANAALASTLSTMNADMKVITKSLGIKPESKKSLIASEKSYSANLTKILDDSYQRGTLDRIYTNQMTYELTSLKNMLLKLQKSSSSKNILSYCKTSIENIDLVLKIYKSFDASKS